MATKVPKATKDLAYAKLKQGLGNQEVADLTGLSLRSIGRMKSLLEGKSALPARKARTANPTPPLAESMPPIGQPQEEQATLDFAESAVDVEKKSVIDSAFSSLKNMLGITGPEKTEKTPPPLLSAKLDPKRQHFVDATAPTFALVAMGIAGWMWGQVGPEYAILAPDETVARRIVEPLLRIYARHASFLTDINPDMADMGASLFALAGYVHVSLKMYQEIKRQEFEDDSEEAETRATSTARRAYRAAAAQPESRTRDARGGPAAVQWADGRNDRGPGRNVGDPSNLDLSHLTEKQAREYETLSRLTQLDYQHRARRSGRTS